MTLTEQMKADSEIEKLVTDRLEKVRQDLAKALVAEAELVEIVKLVTQLPEQPQ